MTMGYLNVIIYSAFLDFRVAVSFHVVPWQKRSTPPPFPSDFFATWGRICTRTRKLHTASHAFILKGLQMPRLSSSEYLILVLSEG